MSIRFSKTIIMLSLISALVVVHAEAQFEHTDSTKTDSLLSSKMDTIKFPIIPIPFVGTIDRAITSEQILSDTSRDMMDYKNVGDLLLMKQGLFIQDLGSPGQLHGITIQGVDARAIGFASDGVSLNDPFTGVYNFNLYPSENFERIEIISGTRAFLFGLNSTGSVINLVSKNRKAYKPFTRIRYSETIYGNGFFDGMFSQNITRTFNVGGGVQHATYNGRFPNSDEDSWNARIQLRYNVNNRLNFFASEIYNKTELGLNGGVDTSTQFALRFVPLQASMRSTTARENITRHDIQLGTAAELFADTSFITTLTFFHSTNLREYRDADASPSPIAQDHWSQWYGARLMQDFQSTLSKTVIGGEIQSRGVIASSVTSQHLETYKNIFGKNEFHLNNIIDFAVYGKLENYLSRSKISYGGDVALSPVSWIKLFGGYSTSYRFPTVQELYWQDTIVSGQSSFVPEEHRLFEGGIRLTDHDETLVELKYFRRVINDVILITPTAKANPFPTLGFIQRNQLTMQGINGTAQVHFGKFYGEGNVQFIEFANSVGKQSVLPKWCAIGGIYYWNKLFNDNLNLKVGFRGRIFTAYTGNEYNPQAWMYVPSLQPQVNQAGVGDFVLLAHISDAYVHFIWENLLNLPYAITPFYPMTERSVRFGVSWEFTN